MAPVHSSSNDAGRESPVRVARRQLITSRGSQEMPTPRVVLHLPDLDALQTVALGPIRPASSRRRIDTAHDVEPTSNRANRKRDTKKTSEVEEAPASPLLNLLRVPINKWLPPLGSGKLSVGSVGQFVVMLQQPKVLLGAIVAVAMQLAAVLAMLSGGGTATDKSTSPTTTGGAIANTPSRPASSGMLTPSNSGFVGGQNVGDQHAGHSHGPIRTPVNVMINNGQPFAGPSLMPAPQALSGVDAKDVPPWQAPVATLPAPTSTNVATPKSESVAAPTIGTGNLAIGGPDVSNASVETLPSLSTNGTSTNGPTNIVQTSSARAKLKGTIQRKPNGGANP